EDQDYFSLYMHSPEDERHNREKLIEAAKNRLRHKMLESKFQSILKEIIELQSRLDIVRIDTASSIKFLNENEVVTEQRLICFERRLETHRAEFDMICSYTKGSHTPINNYKDDSMYQHLMKSHQLNSSIDYTPDEPRDTVPVENHIDTLQTVLSHTPTSDTRLHSLSEDGVHRERNGINTLSIPAERNALDDTLSFLNDLSSNTDDGGFREDIYQLLNQYEHMDHDTVHWNLYQLSHHQPNDSTHKRNTLFDTLVSTGWKWIKFSLVMTIAIMMNLKRGYN
ncbi:hypothetical protein BDB01DRAFT_704410, partial [Pilobolus umbonatus]